MSSSRLLLFGAAFCLTPGCRPDPGVPEYKYVEDFDKLGQAPAEPLPGPNPFSVGDERLDVGVFYEGGSSEKVIIDDVTTHFYIYGLESDMTPTFSLKADKTVVEEGLVSDRIGHGGTPWWGGGVHWDEARALSSWTTLHVSLHSDSDVFAEVEIQLQSIDADDPEKSADGKVNASDYGYKNDGSWHQVAIPLSDMSGVNIEQISAPFVLVGGGGEKNARLYVDNLYFTKE